MSLSDCPSWTRTLCALDEFLALPEIKPYLEFDGGRVSQKHAANADHGALQADIAIRLGTLARAQRLGIACIETRFVTPAWVPTPDVSLYRRERIRPVSRSSFGEMHVAPDIAVEIASPGEGIEQLVGKCVRYAAFGTVIGLVIVPDDETVHNIRTGEPLRVLRGDDTIDLEPVLPGFDLTVQALFDSMVDDWLLNGDQPDA